MFFTQEEQKKMIEEASNEELVCTSNKKLFDRFHKSRKQDSKVTIEVPYIYFWIVI